MLLLSMAGATAALTGGFGGKFFVMAETFEPSIRAMDAVSDL
jgi:hypothetical protein